MGGLATAPTNPVSATESSSAVSLRFLFPAAFPPFPLASLPLSSCAFFLPDDFLTPFGGGSSPDAIIASRRAIRDALYEHFVFPAWQATHAICKAVVLQMGCPFISQLSHIADGRSARVFQSWSGGTMALFAIILGSAALFFCCLGGGGVDSSSETRWWAGTIWGEILRRLVCGAPASATASSTTWPFPVVLGSCSAPTIGSLTTPDCNRAAVGAMGSVGP